MFLSYLTHKNTYSANFENILTLVANLPSFGKKMHISANMLLLAHITSDQPNFWSVYSLITGL